MTNGCKKCLECQLSRDKNESGYTCRYFEINHPEKAIEIVEKWAKENPVKTYKSVFFEKFPNALKDCSDKYPIVPVNYIFGGKHPKDEEQYKAWDEEYQEPRP